MGIGIFLTALFGGFRLNGFIAVKKEALSTITTSVLLPNLYILCGIRIGRTDGSIKSQSAAAKKRFLQIRSDALLRLFVSRQVDPASLPPTITAHTFPKATWVSVGGIPLAGFQPFPTSPFPRSRTPDLCSAVKEFMGTRRTRRSREREVAISSPLATRHD